MEKGSRYVPDTAPLQAGLGYLERRSDDTAVAPSDRLRCLHGLQQLLPLLLGLPQRGAPHQLAPREAPPQALRPLEAPHAPDLRSGVEVVGPVPPEHLHVP